jgi:hypothetical protein
MSVQTTIELKTSAQRSCYEKVAKWLQEIFGEMGFPDPESPRFLIPGGSAVTNVFVGPWGDDDATVCVRAYVVMGAELTSDLMYFLLNENADMLFGAFGLDKDGDIFFDHTIVGGHLDKETLKASVKAVMQIADEYDDQIVARWGGKRARD